MNNIMISLWAKVNMARAAMSTLNRTSTTSIVRTCPHADPEATIYGNEEGPCKTLKLQRKHFDSYQQPLPFVSSFIKHNILFLSISLLHILDHSLNQISNHRQPSTCTASLFSIYTTIARLKHRYRLEYFLRLYRSENGTITQHA